MRAQASAVDLDLWACTRGITSAFPWPGNPTDTAFIEDFNGRFHSECLNAHGFLTPADAAENERRITTR